MHHAPHALLNLFFSGARRAREKKVKGVERRIMISFIVEDLVITLNIKVILLFIIFWLLILGLITTKGNNLLTFIITRRIPWLK